VSVKGVGRLPGSGSLNYVAEVIISTPSGETNRVSVRIQKANISGQIENEYTVWREVCNRLNAHENPLVKRYGRLIDGIAKEAYDSLNPKGVELDLAQERDKYFEANSAYKNTEIDSKTGLRVEVVEPNTELQRLISEEFQNTVSVYEYIDHTKLEQISDKALRIAIMKQIVDAEIRALNSGTFDPDGHKGNWLIDLKNKRLVRVDYAQLTVLKAQELKNFKTVFRILIDPSENGKKRLKKLLEENFTEIFDVNEKPASLGEGLSYVLDLSDMPRFSSPMEKLLFIQNELEVFFATKKNSMDLRLRRSISKPMGSFLRLNMYREPIGNRYYIKKLAEFLDINFIKLLLPHLRG